MRRITNPRADEAAAPIVELSDGSVVVPARLAGPVRRILVRDLAEHIRADGGTPTAGVRQLVYALVRAEERHEQPAQFADETTNAYRVMVEISTTDAAAALECSAQYVRRLCRSGHLVGRRIGRAWLIDPASLDAYRHGRTPPMTRPTSLGQAIAPRLESAVQAGAARQAELHRQQLGPRYDLDRVRDAMQLSTVNPAAFAELPEALRTMAAARIAAEANADQDASKGRAL